MPAGDTLRSTSRLSIGSVLVKMVISIVSLAASYVVASNTTIEGRFGYLFLLPMAYAILFILLPAMWFYRKGHIGLTILNALVFVRYVVLPFLLSVTSEAPLRGPAPTVGGSGYGLLVMLVELATAFVVVQVVAPRAYRFESTSEHHKEYIPLESKYVLMGVVCLGAAALVIFPQLLGRYNFFLGAGKISRVSLDFPLSGLVVLATDLVLVVLPLMVISALKTRYDKSPSSVYVLLSLLAILPVVTIFKGTSRFSVVIPTVACLVVLIHLYPAYKKRLALLGGAAALGTFLVFTTRLQARTYDAVGFLPRNMAGLLDVYMSGPNNMGRVVDLERRFGDLMNGRTLLNDLMNNVAILSSFSNSENTTSSWFNYLIYGHRLYADQIIPLSGQSFIHFGPVGTPLLMGLTLSFMLILDGKIKQENRIELVYLLVVVVSYMSLAMMLSFGSIYPLFTNLVLPVWFLFALNRRVRMVDARRGARSQTPSYSKVPRRDGTRIKSSELSA